jgi:Mn-containing catalase
VLQQANHGKANAVWAAGVPGGKNAMRFIIKERGAHELDFTRAIKNIKQKDVGKSLDILQALLVALEYLD